MSERDPEQKDEVVLGYVSGVHGLKGWVKVFSYTDPRHAILDYRPWRLVKEGGEPRSVSIERGQPHGKTIIAALPGIASPETARALVGSEIRVLRAEMPESEAGTWYWSDLLGLAVINREGTTLGTVKQMIETGANDVMVLAGERERLIPFVLEQVVQDVDLAKREIHVDWHVDD